MMFLRGRSSREKLLVALAPFVLLDCFILGMFVIPDYKAAHNLSAQLESRSQLEARTRNLVLPHGPAASETEEANLLKHEKELTASLATEKAAVGTLESAVKTTVLGFRAVGAPATLKAISDLAKREGVIVTESTSAATAVTDDLPGMTRRKLVLRATFPALQAFLAGLAAMGPMAPPLEKLEVHEAVSKDSEDQEEALVATLVLVL